MHRLSILGLALTAFLLPAAGAAGPDGVSEVTILEGSATIIRGLSKLGAVEGARLQPNDLIETGKDTFLRIEFDDGTKLDLGSATRLQLNPPSEMSGDRPGLYLLSGWLKVSLEDTKRSRPPAFSALLFDGTDLAGVVLARVDPRGGAVFIEQGRARLVNRHGKPFAVPPLKTNDFASINKDGRAAIEPHLPNDFLEQMPRAFRDSIPPRYSRYREHEVAAKSLGDFSYGEVEPWINAELSVRRQFVHAWRSKADDPAFRPELVAKLSLHPEWGPVLFPELYQPKAPANFVGPPWPLPQSAASGH
jgi:hypothetical protein